MKKMRFLCAAVALMAPLVAGAVQWDMKSDSFLFPNSDAVRFLKQTNASQAVLKYNPGIYKGYVTFQYTLPQGTKSASLTIYNLSGKRIQSFDLSAANNSVRWGITNRGVTAGIYLAALRYGSFENKIQISIVK